MSRQTTFRAALVLFAMVVSWTAAAGEITAKNIKRGKDASMAEVTAAIKTAKQLRLEGRLKESFLLYQQIFAVLSDIRMYAKDQEDAKKAYQLTDEMEYEVLKAELAAKWPGSKAKALPVTERMVYAAKNMLKAERFDGAEGKLKEAKAVLDESIAQSNEPTKSRLVARLTEVENLMFKTVNARLAKATRERLAVQERERLAQEKERKRESKSKRPATTDPSTKEPETSSAWIFWIVVIVILVVVGGIISAIGSTQCPSCKKLFAAQCLGGEILSSDIEIRTVKKTVVVRNNQGEQVGTQEYDEQVPVKRQLVQANYVCKFCQHGWSTQGWQDA